MTRETDEGDPVTDDVTVDERAAEILAFWELARSSAGMARLGVVTGTTVSESVPPPAWSFGDNPALADDLLMAVLTGEKTATSSALWEYEETGEAVPRVGELSILLDGAGHPRALIRTTSVEIVAFEDVDADFAHAEGEDDRSLESWRVEHEKYFRRVLSREFAPDMPLVCERFELRYPR